jgi:5-methyltetrahydrofolate--homocysteine methyltransferase
MAELAARLSARVDAPLVIDSTDPVVMEAALKRAPGRCLLNSINLEGGEARARAVLALAKAHNAAVIALTIDEHGMAQTAEAKLAIAKHIRTLAVDEFGLPESSLVFDPLTFTLATGSPETADAALQTLEGIRLIKAAIPAAHTLLGVSNISFGLKPAAREVLNSVFLFHAVQTGLDMAILNPAQLCPYAAIAPEARQLAEALIFSRKSDALAELAAWFADDASGSTRPPVLQASSLPPQERVRQRVLLRQCEGIEQDMDAFIQSGADQRARALDLLNSALLPAMQAVGDAFAKGELILPYVLQSAEVMRAATDHLEHYLAGAGSVRKGKLVLATVYGDVHDIGKNLVKSIVSNNGYDVVDLGKQVPVDAIITRAQEEQADAIGLSALLVSTSQQMPLAAAEMQRRGMNIPLLIGGAAINPAFAERAARLPDGSAYRGGVFYCKDAFDALNALNNTLAESRPQKAWQGAAPPAAPAPAAFVAEPVHKQITPTATPHPPFWGSRLVESIPLDALFAQLNHSALFRISWGAANARGEKWEKYRAEFEQRLAHMRTELQSTPWLTASALYGYFRCRAEGDELIILNEDLSEAERFALPRQPFGARLCLADYFAALDGEPGLAIFQIVTLSGQTVAHVHDLQKQGDIAEAFYHHGLAVQLTEAAANWAHQRIREELGLSARQGKRYAWGYPAIPDLAQHAALFRLLPAEKALGLKLTSAFQFVPEYTTAALVAHHPQAAYFRMDA